MKREISIIIAVRDNWQQLVRCFESLATQNSPPQFEVIVVDDGSKTSAPAPVRAWAERFPLQLQCQVALGIPAARNRGVRLATSELFLFTDSDCCLDADCLRRLADAARCQPGEAAFQLALTSRMETLVQKIERVRLKTVQDSLWLASGHIQYAATAGLALRSRAVPVSGELFDITVTRGSDTLLLARLLKEQCMPFYLPDCRVYHCPRTPFQEYLAKQFRIGYQGFYSHDRLHSAGVAAINVEKKWQVARKLLSPSNRRQYGMKCLGAFAMCHALEFLGRATWRMAGVRPGKHRILSVQVDAIGHSEVVYRIASQAEVRRRGWFTYVNAWTLVQARQSKNFLDLLNQADVCYPDGVGVILAAILLNFRRVRKVTANNFIFDLCRELANRKLSVALIGGGEKIVRCAQGELLMAVPDLKINFQSAGFFSPDREAMLVAELVAAQPHVVFVGLGQPRQEEWVAKMMPLLPETVFCCVGGLFDYLAGPRQPADFARRFGMEWCYRFCRSPRTTARRYLYGIPMLFWHVLMDYVERAR